ncbi:CHAT domain-containing protein [Scytonema sp. NUACC26]|uniref:CHAT domain-containing protein n=1 Tax=Scytonema sp. NUACC26 TaxID=3140176 RepID=UPI0034DBDD5B
MTTQPKKILILSAISSNLRLDREIREIEEAIRRATRRDFYEIKTRAAVRSQDIRRALAEEKPQIIHFCGYGMEDGSLVLEDDAGSLNIVMPEPLATLFRLHKNYVECVVLNACHSDKTAEAISEHIDYVIGMNQKITDMAALKFSQGFYDALGYDIQDSQNIFYRAFEEGIIAMTLDNNSEEKNPVFKSKFLPQKKIAISKDSNYSIDLFYRRFMRAFPGVRGLKVFESPIEATQRIAKLLEAPLVIQKFNPILWLRGLANLHISSFKLLKNDIVLIDAYELKINRVAAFNSGLDYQCFVYIETAPMETTLLCTSTQEEIQYWQRKLGYYLEEYGIYNDNYLITRAEYDDRSCIIDGSFKDLEDSKTELRVRYITPYNFLICAIESSINNPSFDNIFEKTLNEILQGGSNLENLVKVIKSLPKKQNGMIEA